MHLAPEGSEKGMTRQVQKSQDALMSIGRHREGLQIAIGELDQPVRMIREPQIALFTPVALIRKNISQHLLELGARYRFACGFHGLKPARRMVNFPPSVYIVQRFERTILP